MKNTNLPDFDEMVKLWKEDPKKIENLRKKMVDEIIASAPIQNQKKLRSLQSRIMLISQGSKNSLDATTKIYSEMLQSLYKLNSQLNQEELKNKDNTKKIKLTSITDD